VFPLVFLVQDDASTPLSRLLQANHYAVRTLLISVTAVLAAAEQRPPTLFLLDAPLEDSLDLLFAIRQHKRLAQIPVLLVSDKTSEDDRVRGFELGADDFVSKLSHPREAAARINAIIRRCAYRQAAARLEVAGIEIDTERFRLSVHGTPVEATATQVRLIEFLMRNEGRVFRRDQILDAVWSNSGLVTPRTIDVHIRRIRQLIEADPSKPAHLMTVRGAGYCFVAQASSQRGASAKSRAWFSGQSEGRAYPSTGRVPSSRRPSGTSYQPVPAS